MRGDREVFGLTKDLILRIVILGIFVVEQKNLTSNQKVDKNQL